MATRTKTTDPVDAARAAVEEARTTLARWEADQAAAEAELASVQDRAGAEVLDDPAAAARLPKLLAGLRDRIEIAGKAIAAQRPRVTAAESAYLTAEADVLEKVAAAARRRLEGHQGRTDELLKLLAEHEGPFVPERRLVEESRSSPLNSIHAGQTFERKLDRSEVLHQELEAAEQPVAILRAMAEGRDPRQMVSEWGIDPASVYPASVWGPDAVVPARAYLAHSGHLRAQLEELEQLAVSLPGEVSELEARESDSPGVRVAGLGAKRRRLETIGEEIAQAHAALERS